MNEWMNDYDVDYDSTYMIIVYNCDKCAVMVHDYLQFTDNWVVNKNLAMNSDLCSCCLKF